MLIGTLSRLFKSQPGHHRSITLKLQLLQMIETDLDAVEGRAWAGVLFDEVVFDRALRRLGEDGFEIDHAAPDLGDAALRSFVHLFDMEHDEAIFVLVYVCERVLAGL